jgi:peptidase E
MIQIVAMGGGGFLMEPDNPLLDDFVLGLGRGDRPRVCFLAAASGDAPGFLEHFYQTFEGRCRPTHLSLFNREVEELEPFLREQDVVYIGGGNTANLVAILRAHRADVALRAAARDGLVLAGVSAGALCWFAAGLTDSFGPRLSPLDGGLGFVDGSMCPHYNHEPRRPLYQALIAEGRIPGGVAADDGAALHFADGALVEVVTSRPEARAFRVARTPAGCAETGLPARFLG